MALTLSPRLGDLRAPTLGKKGCRRPRQPRQGHRAGFSLLELLVALFILSIGAASVLALYATAAGTHRRALDRTNAALIAERVFAEVQGRYTPGKSVKELEADLRDPTLGVPSAFGDYSWDVHLFFPAGQKKGVSSGALSVDRNGVEDSSPWTPRELVVRVFVRWKERGRDRSDTFFTILLPRNLGALGEAAPRR